MGRALKFGGSQIQFVEFPYRLSKPVEIRWQPATGIVRANKGSFTLRCAEEWFEMRGSGKNRSRILVQEEIWSGTWFLDQHTFSRAEQIELRFELPNNLPPMRLSADRPIFWELEVKLDLPGLDFEERYLVPVYDSP